MRALVALLALHACAPQFPPDTQPSRSTDTGDPALVDSSPGDSGPVVDTDTDTDADSDADADTDVDTSAPVDSSSGEAPDLEVDGFSLGGPSSAGPDRYEFTLTTAAQFVQISNSGGTMGQSHFDLGVGALDETTHTYWDACDATLAPEVASGESARYTGDVVDLTCLVNIGDFCSRGAYGPFTFAVKVDPNDDVAEAVESNNVAVATNGSFADCGSETGGAAAPSSPSEGAPIGSSAAAIVVALGLLVRRRR